MMYHGDFHLIPPQPPQLCTYHLEKLFLIIPVWVFQIISHSPTPPSCYSTLDPLRVYARMPPSWAGWMPMIGGTDTSCSSPCVCCSALRVSTWGISSLACQSACVGHNPTHDSAASSSSVHLGHIRYGQGSTWLTYEEGFVCGGNEDTLLCTLHARYNDPSQRKHCSLAEYPSLSIAGCDR